MEQAAEFKPGDLVAGRYEILDKLGAGASATVFRVRDVDLKSEYALKIHRSSVMTTDGEELARMKREALLSQRVVNEACCRVYDFLVLDGRAMLKMELVSGRTLAELMSRYGPLPVPLALTLAVQAASSVAVLHRQGIVHRDVKASNLMVTSGGRVKVMDMGISWSPDLSSLTLQGALLGTPAYMAPELILRQETSAQSDVYALGVLSYYLVTGRLPFVASDMVKMFGLQIDAQPPKPSTLRPELDPQAEAVILRCLHKEPSKRPADAAALEAAWNEAGVKADPQLVGEVFSAFESGALRLPEPAPPEVSTASLPGWPAPDDATRREPPGGRRPGDTTVTLPGEEPPTLWRSRPAQPAPVAVEEPPTVWRSKPAAVAEPPAQALEPVPEEQAPSPAPEPEEALAQPPARGNGLPWVAIAGGLILLAAIAAAVMALS